MNTPNKRASAIGIALAFRLVLPVPDGTVDTPDRPHVAYSYAGIAVSPAFALDICEATVESLIPVRTVESLTAERTVASLNPIRSVDAECSV